MTWRGIVHGGSSSVPPPPPKNLERMGFAARDLATVFGFFALSTPRCKWQRGTAAATAPILGTAASSSHDAISPIRFDFAAPLSDACVVLAQSAEARRLSVCIRRLSALPTSIACRHVDALLFIASPESSCSTPRCEHSLGAVFVWAMTLQALLRRVRDGGDVAT
jgi:hypothetical protein